MLLFSVQQDSGSLFKTKWLWTLGIGRHLILDIIKPFSPLPLSDGSFALLRPLSLSTSTPAVLEPWTANSYWFQLPASPLTIQPRSRFPAVKVLITRKSSFISKRCCFCLTLLQFPSGRNLLLFFLLLCLFIPPLILAYSDSSFGEPLKALEIIDEPNCKETGHPFPHFVTPPPVFVPEQWGG